MPKVALLTTLYRAAAVWKQLQLELKISAVKSTLYGICVQKPPFPLGVTAPYYPRAWGGFLFTLKSMYFYEFRKWVKRISPAPLTPLFDEVFGGRFHAARTREHWGEGRGCFDPPPSRLGQWSPEPSDSIKEIANLVGGGGKLMGIFFYFNFFPFD